MKQKFDFKIQLESPKLVLVLVLVQITLLRSLKGKIKKPRTFAAFYKHIGAGNEIRTRDPNLGKVVLYH
jgi:hypothetical protein